MKGKIKVWVKKLSDLLKRRGVADYPNSEYFTKRPTRVEARRRRKIFDQTKPHNGNDLVAALEFENFMRDNYTKGGK